MATSETQLCICLHLLIRNRLSGPCFIFFYMACASVLWAIMALYNLRIVFWLLITCKLFIGHRIDSLIFSIRWIQ